jgi:LPPG:FO 2-phospho-L-lactate transferase
MKVAVLAGGVGGARMALGFAGLLAPEDLKIVVNVGDDERFHGLYVCPDLDTVVYTLAGAVDPAQGWGVAEDTTRALQVLRKLDSPGAWMKLGDADIGLHVYRSFRLAQGASLTVTTNEVRRAFGVGPGVLPASDDECPTEVETDSGVLRFQEWFVRDRAQPAVKALKFDAARSCRITEDVRNALLGAGLIVFAPSNPFLSILPMLELGGMRQTLKDARGLKVAVSPLIGGRAIKGPLVKLMHDLGRNASNKEIARFYSSMADLLVIDESDSQQLPEISREASMKVAAFSTSIQHAARSQVLARWILDHVERAA